MLSCHVCPTTASQGSSYYTYLNMILREPRFPLLYLYNRQRLTIDSGTNTTTVDHVTLTERDFVQQTSFEVINV